MQASWAFCSRLSKYDSETTAGFLAILLLDATQRLCVGTARSLDTLQTIAAMIQSAIDVVRLATLLVSAMALIFQSTMQVSATTDTSQAIILLTAEMRRLATIVGKPVILLVIVLANQSATYVIYQVMWPVNVASQAWD